MNTLEPLRWTYKLRVDVDETGNNALDKGLKTVWLEGQSRNYDQLYPLNQVKISGGNLSSKIKVHVGPSVTQIYYYPEGFLEMDGIEEMLGDKEEAERILNCVVVFASGETARFDIETATPVLSSSMLVLETKLKAKTQEALEGIQLFTLNQAAQAIMAVAQGDTFSASRCMNRLLSELTLIQDDLVAMAKKEGIAEAEEREG